ncbi:hypothetical protein ACKWTF_011167 [Chironomus riparius]
MRKKKSQKLYFIANKNFWFTFILKCNDATMISTSAINNSYNEVLLNVKLSFFAQTNQILDVSCAFCFLIVWTVDFFWIVSHSFWIVYCFLILVLIVNNIIFQKEVT